MTALEMVLFGVWLLWWIVCMLTAALKGRGLGWGVAAALLPPLYVVLLLTKTRETKPERVRCTRCKLGWVNLERLPRVCSGCGEEIPLAELQTEMHKDML